MYNVVYSGGCRAGLPLSLTVGVVQFRQNVSSHLVVVVVIVIVTIPCYPYTTGEILSPRTKCDLKSQEKYISDKMRNIKKSSQTSPRDRSEDDESFSSLSDSEPVEVCGPD